MLITYKFRIYPTREQEEKLSKHFGHTRFVYNFFLNYASTIYKVMGRSTYYNEWASVLTKLKRMDKYSWLKEVNSQILQQSLKDLERAFKNFFKKQAGYPRFKKKKFSRQTFRVPQHIQLYIKEDNPKYGLIFVPKFKEGIKVRLHRKITKDGKIKQATFIKTATNKYYVAIVFEVKDVKVQNTSTNILGIDLGIKDTITLSDGRKYSIPDLFEYEKRLKRLHKRLSRKQKGSKNRDKARLRLAKLYEKIANVKIDWLHKITHSLTSKNQVGKIVVEDLNIKGMVQNHKLAKHIHMQSWGKFKELLEYKAKRCGIEIIKADRYYPSSQMCSECGYINKEVKNLSIREWTCPECGAHHDRDVNAAKNLAKYGLILSVGREPSEFTPVDSALAAEPERGLRAITG
ncbi:MAG: putative transposase [Thermoanaerobacter sp.]|jgi:putative transposase|nr:putative transposase [Thermoanaerobacter sp.]MDK2900797.1 putative transposase [Thermosipho sp. (in: thermotogales)]